MKRVGVLAFVLSALAVTVPARAADVIPNVYVSMGDSFTAGPLVPLPTGDPIDCGQSTSNYPRLVAAAISAPVHKDVSCNGADTADFGKNQDGTFGGGPNPPQYDALGPHVGLVTIGIGGNDMGFSSIIDRCVQLPNELGGAPCTPTYVHDGRDELAEKIAEGGPKVLRAYQEVKRRAPNAEIYVLDYPSLLPDSGVGCYPYVPVRNEDVPYLVGIHKKLNAMIKTQAAAAGVHYVSWYAPSVGHDACQIPTVAWVNGAVIVPPSFFGHPNADGERGGADAVLGALQATGFEMPTEPVVTSNDEPKPTASEEAVGEVASAQARLPDTGGLPALPLGLAISVSALLGTRVRALRSRRAVREASRVLHFRSR